MQSTLRLIVSFPQIGHFPIKSLFHSRLKRFSIYSQALQYRYQVNIKFIFNFKRSRFNILKLGEKQYRISFSKKGGGRDLNPWTPAGIDLESIAFSHARQPPRNEKLIMGI